MAYPVLAPQQTWFKSTVATIDQMSAIIIFPSWESTGWPESVLESTMVKDRWNADVDDTGSIFCFLIYAEEKYMCNIVGNGSGKIALNSTYDAFVKSFDVENVTINDPNNVLLFYPVLAPQDTWFTQGNHGIEKSDINRIMILDTFNPANPDAFTMWDASAALDGNVRCAFSSATKDVIIYGNGSGKIALNPDSSKLFLQFYNLTMITGAERLDTSNVENFSMAFAGRPGEGGEMALRSVDVSTWDTSKCTNMSFMFLQCVNLGVINVSNWDMSNVTNISQMFWGCNRVQALDVSKWNISKVENMLGAFGYCSIIPELDISGWVFNPNVTEWNFMLTFAGLAAVKELDLSNVPFDKCTSLAVTFIGLASIETLKLPGHKFGNIKSFSSLFEGCSSLKNLDTSDWDTSGCEDMSFMFYGCTGLKEIDVSKWDTSKVKNFDHFAAHANLRRKGIENWNTASATNMNAMFHNCAEEELDLSGFDTSKVQFFTQMFENSQNLKHIKGLDKWDTSNAVGFDEMFGRCYKLEELDLSSFNTLKAKNGVQASSNGHTTGTFRNFCNDCRNLKWIKLGPNFSVNGDGTNTNAEYKLILPTPSADYIEGADGNWYTFIGDAYAPNAVKDKIAETYYASYSIVADQDVIVKNGSMIDAAKAIREKNGTTTSYTPAQFGAAIRAL